MSRPYEGVVHVPRGEVVWPLPPNGKSIWVEQRALFDRNTPMLPDFGKVTNLVTSDSEES